jgi:hypothetical protein
MTAYTDKQLHEMARKRVDFRRHLIVYCIINAIFWIIWYLTGHGYPWPLWPMAGWSIGLIFHYVFEFRSPKFLSEEEEFNKLKNKGNITRT